MIEIILGAMALSFALDKIKMSTDRTYNSHIMPTYYKLTRSWWKGAFEPDSSGRALANMIDSDVLCEVWHESNGDIISESLGVKITCGYWERVRINIKKNEVDKNGLYEWLTVEASEHDDYLLRTAIKEFTNRKFELEKRKIERETTDLINKSVSKNYVDIIDRVETKILGKDPEEANALRAMFEASPPPPEKTPVKKNEKAYVGYICKN